MHKGQPQAAGCCRVAGGFCRPAAAAPLTSTEPRALASAQRQEGFSPGAAASLQAVASWAHAQYCAAAVAVVHRAGIARGWLMAEGQIAPVLLPVHQLGSSTQSCNMTETLSVKRVVWRSEPPLERNVQMTQQMPPNLGW
jgi:hypothetical protein